MHGVQLEQGGRAADVPLLGAGMGRVRHSRQYDLPGCKWWLPVRCSQAADVLILVLQYIRTAMTDQLLAENPKVKDKWMAGALLGRLGAPEDFKAPSVFLLSEGSSFMHGADLRVDGGHCASA